MHKNRKIQIIVQKITEYEDNNNQKILFDQIQA